MTEFMTYTLDKFIFRVANDRYYDSNGLWIFPEGHLARIGLSDFLQQRSGDIAFAETVEIGSKIVVGDEIAEIETIKVDFSVESPISGTVIEVNPKLELEPEIINEDPYDTGWLLLIETEDWPSAKDDLLDPEAYFNIMAAAAEEERD